MDQISCLHDFAYPMNTPRWLSNIFLLTKFPIRGQHELWNKKSDIGNGGVTEEEEYFRGEVLKPEYLLRSWYLYQYWKKKHCLYVLINFVHYRLSVICYIIHYLFIYLLFLEEIRRSRKILPATTERTLSASFNVLLYWLYFYYLNNIRFNKILNECHN